MGFLFSITAAWGVWFSMLMCYNELINEARGYCRMKLAAMLEQAGRLPVLSHKAVGGWSYYLRDNPCSPDGLQPVCHIPISSVPSSEWHQYLPSWSQEGCGKLQESVLTGQHIKQEGGGHRTKYLSSGTSCHTLELWQLSFDHAGQGCRVWEDGEELCPSWCPWGTE